MNNKALISSHFEQLHTIFALLLIIILSIALLFAILASSPLELMETAAMIAIPP
jgi:hypothetical protein